MVSEAPEASSELVKAKNAAIFAMIEKLSIDWDMNLRQPQYGNPPSSVLAKVDALDRRCISVVKLLVFKDAIEEVIANFEEKATAAYTGWVHKPNADRKLLPKSTSKRPCPVTATERRQLKELFLEIASDRTEGIKEQERTRGTRSGGGTNRKIPQGAIDDSRIPFPLDTSKGNKTPLESIANQGTKTDSKRPRDTVDGDSNFKRPRRPGSNSPPGAGSRDAVPIERGRQVVQDYHAPRSNNTSFASVLQASVFSQSINRNSFQNTQETEPDPSPVLPDPSPTFDTQAYRSGDQDSSNYGSSFSNPEALMTSFDRPESPQNSQVVTEEEENISQDLLGFAFAGNDVINSPKVSIPNKIGCVDTVSEE